MKTRYLTDYIVGDLEKKMVFVGGPRQVGKTTLSFDIAKRHFSSSSYFNWDYQPDRKKIISYQLPGESGLLIFDEFHKYKNWKNHLKGIYDKFQGKYKILVTGSARLDIYRKGGDALTGRYFYYLLHPFSLGEVLEIKNEVKPFSELTFLSDKKATDFLGRLLEFGGFPEPFLKKDRRFLRRWQAERIDRLVKEEIRDIEQIEQLSQLQLLAETLPDKVGSTLSLNNLKEDLQISYKTVFRYLNILERFYYHFRIYPYARIKFKSVKKLSKIYLWDWSQLENKGARFENLIASHLLKFAHFLKNVQGYPAQLYYLRDLEGREVDFLISIGAKPWFAVEVKLNDAEASRSLSYFKKKLSIPYAYQVVQSPNIDVLSKDVRIISADKFLSGLI